MADEKRCPACRQPARRVRRLDGCECEVDRDDLAGTAPQDVDESVYADVIAHHDRQVRAALEMPGPMLGATAVSLSLTELPELPVAPEVLGRWDSWWCGNCGARRFEPFDCCGSAAAPVTVTMTRREASDV